MAKLIPVWLQDERAEVDNLISIAIGLAVLMVVIGYVFAPVGLTAFQGNYNNISTLTYNSTNNTKTLILSSTYITMTKGYAVANTTFNLEDISGINTYTQTQGIESKYTLSGGNVWINVTSSQVNYGIFDIKSDKLYGLTNTSRNIWSSIIPIALAVLIIGFVFIIKKEI